MSPPPDLPKPSPNTLSNEEARMRQALGLRDGAPTPRPPQRRDQDHGRRFVRDGEVPVVVLNGPRDRGAEATAPMNRVAAAEQALKAERGVRERAERALQEAQATIQLLQTRLAHAELAHTEALAAEHQAREAAEQALAEVGVTVVGPRLAESPMRSMKPRRRKAVAREVEREPEPVKWWLPSYRAKLRKR